MRYPVILLLILLTVAFTAGCTNVEEVTLGGPSVTDQLNSRGYIATEADTTMPIDTTNMLLDSLREK
ncbi:MAG: hypothetical protein ABIY71_02710 [Flavobacteriales bacterium]